MLIPKSLILSIQLILRGLSPGSLVKFTWCYPWLPNGIMDLNGYIPRSQPQIVSLELYTQAGDETGTGQSSIAEEISIDGLVRLRYLTCLVWHGICPCRHALVLDTCIWQNSGTLERLDLRFLRRVVDRMLLVTHAYNHNFIEFSNLQMLILENMFISESKVITSLLSHPSITPLYLSCIFIGRIILSPKPEAADFHRYYNKNCLYWACYGLFQKLQKVLRTSIDKLLDLIQGLLNLYCSQACLPFKNTVELLYQFYLEPASDLSKCEGLLGPCASRPFALMGELLDYLRLFTSQPVPTSADVMQLVRRLAHPVPSLDTVERFLSRHCLQQFPSLRAVVQLLDLFYLQPGLSLAQAEEHLSRYSTQPSPPLGLLIEYLSELKSQQPCVSTADIAVRMLQHMRALGNREREAEDAWNNLLRAS
ncbi:hypothetical protein BO94DRAFT_552600 [Aspergillus sclerotioniger CBS 115572]|uniref:Uncharacterized protein n=1 Tax=Aspergillus sclerotioniger CBS 115572 TaxID=1450535 RepID=A0A317XAZ5_9EURO|nr:hypothetical protein BO94DRAFT_552600 [Aspergillus sclerotioniger CBS 115572]PWY95763.1 hypothetical protein BO94DRAFT_552600 [Aspergillus sclerotioniger CBS 115572]